MRSVLTRRVSAAAGGGHYRRPCAHLLRQRPQQLALGARRAASSDSAAASEVDALSVSLPSFEQDRIRSFCIIAHVDHGKSTLADRLLEETGVIKIEEDEDGRALQAQIMDTLEIEQQRGITVKAMHASLVYTPGQLSSEKAKARAAGAAAAAAQQQEIEEDLGDDDELRELAAELAALDAAEAAYKQNTAELSGSYLLNLIDTPGHVDFSHEVMRTLGACQSAVLLVDAVQGVQAQTVAVHAAARGERMPPAHTPPRGASNFSLVLFLSRSDLDGGSCSCCCLCCCLITSQRPGC